ncbi:MAG: hypothetical protein K0R76_204 [Alphaproteobacteria bacterium]|jgi:hypothetical protein|nr:hypothetical protein [Alphaproteobacteria bacterium]MDF3033250.1 hypothetical protein [Alphaproteobacteria bacterium]
MKLGLFKKILLLKFTTVFFLSLLSSAFSSEKDEREEEKRGFLANNGRHQALYSLKDMPIKGPTETVVRFLGAGDLSCFMQTCRAMNEEVHTLVNQDQEIKFFLIKEATKKLRYALLNYNGELELEKIALLLKAGLDPNMRYSMCVSIEKLCGEQDYRIAMEEALCRGLDKVVDLLLRHGATLNDIRVERFDSEYFQMYGQRFGMRKEYCLKMINKFSFRRDLTVDRFSQYIHTFFQVCLHDTKSSIPELKAYFQKKHAWLFKDGAEYYWKGCAVPDSSRFDGVIEDALSLEGREKAERLKRDAMNQASKGLLSQRKNPAEETAASVLHASFNSAQAQQNPQDGQRVMMEVEASEEKEGITNENDTSRSTRNKSRGFSRTGQGFSRTGMPTKKQKR